MKKLFDACRQLLGEQRRNPQPLKPAVQGLYDEMALFERHNRGHQHLLDELAERERRYTSRHDPELWKRMDASRERLRETLQGLFTALVHLDEVDFPGGPAFLEALRTPTTSPMLTEVLDMCLRRMLLEQMPSRKAYLSQLQHRRQGVRWVFELTLRHSSRDLTAKRDFVLELQEPASLAQAWAQCRAALRAGNDILRTMDQYPEFSEAAYLEKLCTRARGELYVLLRQFSPQDRALLRDSWPQLLRDFERTACQP